MSDAALKRLAVHTSHYSVASLFALIAGLVTFPLFTRIFSVEDYGAMSLIGATVTIAVALGKLGVQHSIVRYHSEISAGKSRYTLRQLYSTTLVGMGVTGLVAALGVAVFAQFAPESWVRHPRLRGVIAIATILITMNVLESAVVNVVRAEQKTAALMKYQVAKKYLSFAFIVGAVLLVSRSLTAFYTASGLAEIVGVGAFGWYIFGGDERARPQVSAFSRPLYTELLGFGIPMMIGYEISGIVLSVGDRYVIDGLLGEAPVGLYGAAYNLCQYVQALVIASVGQALMPIYMKIFDEQGAPETSAFIGKSLRTYVLFAAPVIGGLAAVGPELLTSLASEKYHAASSILPWVIAGMIVDGTNTMVGAGLFIHRKTRVIMSIVLSCAVLNIVLNLVLVPRIGILGSAIATLVCYFATATSMAVAGRRFLSIPVPWSTVARAAFAATVMYVALLWIYPGHGLLTVGIRAALGAVFYVGVMAVVDSDARAIVAGGLDRVRRKLGR